MLPEIICNYDVSILLCGNTDGLCNVAHILYNNPIVYTGLLKMTVGVLTTCHTQYT